MEATNIKLIYIHNLGLNAENKFHYNFYFIPNSMELCNENWQEDNVGLFNERYITDENTITYSLISQIPLALITNNLCLGMKHAIDGVVALGWEDISDYEEYPDEGRLVLYYGMSLEEVNELLSIKSEELI